MLHLIDKYFLNSSDIDKVNLVVAIVNAFDIYMGSLKNWFEIFKEKLGFDLYVLENGKKCFNKQGYWCWCFYV